MFDEEFSFLIEQKYPYPVAVTFRRLETDEYVEAGPVRLKGILETAERTAHLLAHVALVNAFEHVRAGGKALPKGLAVEFEKRFSALSFGSLIHLLRETTLFLKDQDALFLPELFPYIFDEIGKPSEVLKAWDTLVSVRNRLAHPTHAYAPKELGDFCQEAEEALTAVLRGLDFMGRYEVLSVNQIEVLKKRAKEPAFKHRFSRVVGVSENFKAREDSFPQFMDSHAVVLKKRDAFSFLDLSPLVIFSNEGEKQVPDIFLYTGTKGTGYLYTACNNGGAFDSRNTSLQADLQEEIGLLLRTLSEGGER